MSIIMFVTKRYKFVLLKFIIFVSVICSVWNETQGKENMPYGLQKIDFFRKKFGPVKMLSHVNNHSDLNEVTLKADDEINQNDESVTETAVNGDDGTGIVQKDSMPAISVTEDPMKRKVKGLPPLRPKQAVEDHSIKNCWMDANTKEHFELMDGLDDRYASVRKKYQEAAERDNFSKDMLDMMIKTRGVAQREIHQAKGDPSFIPAGINLGGYSMLRLDDSILFFHRMKLRNNTHFRIKSLKNDLANMALTAQLSLNDLHILGAYERATTLSDPVQLFYTPTFGEAEFLLKNVEYKMEGRYRMLRDKLAIELVISDMIVNDILLTYTNSERCAKSVVLERKNIDEFLDKLKVDFDKWLKDYFNDYLMYFGLVGEKSNAKFIEYNQQKTIALNEYTDKILVKIGRRLREIKLCAVRLPLFSVTAVNGMQLKLTHGVLRGLESIHRRSLATGKRENGLRKVNAIVGFSSLTATYQYEALFNTGVPPINGMLVVTADDMIAHFSLTLTEDPKSGDLRFDSIQQLKPESLTLEGPANRIIGNFKALLERHVFTFISNAIIHNVIMLRTLTQCEPLLFSIHFTCEEENENEKKSPNSSTDDNKIEKQSHLRPNDKETSLENIPSEINPNTDTDNQNLEQDVAENEQKEATNLSNEGEENNDESNGPKGGADVEIKLITKNEDNANENSGTNTNLNANNNKDHNENANADIGTDRDLDYNKDENSNGNENSSLINTSALLKDDFWEVDEVTSNSDNKKDVEIKIIPNVEDNINGNSETNRNLETNDEVSNENSNDNIETNRHLDTNNSENSNDNEKSTSGNAGGEDDEVNAGLADDRQIAIKIIPNDQDNTNSNSETNRNLKAYNDKESSDNE